MYNTKNSKKISFNRKTISEAMNILYEEEFIKVTPLFDFRVEIPANIFSFKSSSILETKVCKRPCPKKSTPCCLKSTHNNRRKIKKKEIWKKFQKKMSMSLETF